MLKRLTDTERAALADSLPLWTVSDDGLRIERAFRFRDFNEAWGFMTRVALLAEQQDHHPDWSNVWSTVRIALTTHAADGLTTRDIRMARAIDGLGENAPSPP